MVQESDSCRRKAIKKEEKETRKRKKEKGNWRYLGRIVFNLYLQGKMKRYVEVNAIA